MLSGERNLQLLLSQVQTRYVVDNPQSAELHRKACDYLPGGNTRSTLHVDPFPLTFVGGKGALSQDADGHEYVDLIGNYTACLYGHSNPIILAAMKEALDGGLGICSSTTYETLLASAICFRFPSIDLVRFCNSGTEANLMALAAAKTFTGRENVIVFKKAYHGGVLLFDDNGPSCVTVPHAFVMADYDDVEGTRELIRQNAWNLAAILVEPMLGSAGCIPASIEFLQMLRQESSDARSVLIFDEVQTSRLSAGGLQLLSGVTPDMTTLGKYVGGGMAFGAFGGKRDIMSLFDPRSPSHLRHAGTFNNETLSLKAGYVGLTEIYTPEVAAQHNAIGDEFRAKLNRVTDGTWLRFIGLGSMIGLYFSPQPCGVKEILSLRDDALRSLFYFEMVHAGFHLSKRGFIALSLEITDEHRERFLSAVRDFLQRYSDLLRCS